MERVSLDVSKRNEGKSSARAVRNAAMVPGILYGKNVKPMTISVNEKALETAVKTKAGMNVLFDLNIESGEKTVARIADYQACAIKRNFTHVDFAVVDITKKISVEIPLHFEGKAKGVIEGGVLIMDRRTLEVKCLPLAIPEFISIDITELDIGDGIHLNELKLPEGVECAHDVNFGIVSVVAPMKEEVVVPTAEAVVAEGAAAPAAGAAPGAAPGSVPGAAPGTAPAAGAKSAPGSAPAAGAKQEKK
ncbi:MAG: 50S ribosomal protein L25 [Deltaproteobacteria bacterium CG11_big_fil_rev_8_21_14_0_20_49_13]|nr:MAG: 50S ribosomal protein L25 [Deltaproteobacteria bacterium CG11_big_fil_rev_8_21_14_0_20_49_13]